MAASKDMSHLVAKTELQCDLLIRLPGNDFCHNLQLAGRQMTVPLRFCFDDGTE